MRGACPPIVIITPRLTSTTPVNRSYLVIMVSHLLNKNFLRLRFDCGYGGVPEQKPKLGPHGCAHIGGQVPVCFIVVLEGKINSNLLEQVISRQCVFDLN